MRRQKIASYVRQPINRYDVECGCYERYRIRGGWIEVMDRGAGMTGFTVRERGKNGISRTLSVVTMEFLAARDLAEKIVNELYEGYEKVRQDD